MDEEGFTYAMLRKLERAENTSPRLQRLEARFWERLGEHLGELRQAFHDQQEEDPTSRRTVVLADELRNTQRLTESIWGFREKKVVQAALAATRRREGATEPPEHTTPEERQLFDSVCAVLQRSRDEAAITDPFSRRSRAAREAAEASGTPTSAPAVPQTATHTSQHPEGGPAVGQVAQATTVDRGGVVPHGPEGSDRGGPGRQDTEGEAEAPPLEGRGGVGAVGAPEVELRLVQALKDVPKFSGLDLVDYELAAGEIGNLPARAVETLVKKGLVRALAE